MATMRFGTAPSPTAAFRLTATSNLDTRQTPYSPKRGWRRRSRPAVRRPCATSCRSRLDAGSGTPATPSAPAPGPSAPPVQHRLVAHPEDAFHLQDAGEQRVSAGSLPRLGEGALRHQKLAGELVRLALGLLGEVRSFAPVLVGMEQEMPQLVRRCEYPPLHGDALPSLGCAMTTTITVRGLNPQRRTSAGSNRRREREASP